MVAIAQKSDTQKTSACKKPWRTPRVIESELEQDTNGGSVNLPEANGGLLSS